jgi:uncharacterized protein YukE
LIESLSFFIEEISMTKIIVSPEALREKARLLRQLLDERKMAHQNLWNQLSNVASTLPADLRASDEIANSPWNEAIGTIYDNYYQLAQAMEKAADAYERGDKNVQISFTFAD